MSPKSLIVLLAGSAVAAVAVPANAGLISQTLSSLGPTGAEIINAGSTVAAWNFYGNDNANPVINGITFPDAQPATITVNYDGGQGAVTRVDNSTTVASRYSTSDMKSLMQDYARSNWGGGYAMTVSGLTIGQSYTVQFMFDSPDTPAWQTYYFGGTSSTDSIHFVSDTAAHQANGQIVTTVFIADAATQLFTIKADSGYKAVLNGLSVTTAVPEPLTMAMLVPGFFLVARRRRA